MFSIKVLRYCLLLLLFFYFVHNCVWSASAFLPFLIVELKLLFVLPDISLVARILIITIHIPSVLLGFLHIPNSIISKSSKDLDDTSSLFKSPLGNKKCFELLNKMSPHLEIITI